MRSKKPSSSSGPPLSRWRVLAGLLTVTATVWWLNWVRAGATPSDDNTKEEAVAPPAVSEPVPLPRGMDELVSLDLRSTDASDAIKFLATKGGLNIAISKNVAGRVNLLLNDVPIRDVFDLILRSNSLAYDKQGTVYNIMTEEEYRTLYGKKFSDLREVRTFRLQYAVPQQAFNMLDTLKSEIGRLLVDEESGTVMVMDTPEKLHAMEQALSVLEQGGQTRVFDLKYAKAADVEERLKDQLELNKLGYVKSDARSNQLIIKTLPDRMKEIAQVVEALDRKTRQVLIDSKIVKVSLEKDMDSGLDWDQVFSNLKFHGMDPVGDFRRSTTGTAPSEVPAVQKINISPMQFLGSDKYIFKSGALAFGTIARDGYELFRYLETVGNVKIISNPRLLVTENQEAKIHVGTREAYITTTTTTGQTTSTTAEDVNFIDVGIQFSVTPTINEDGFVTLKVKPEVSSVVRTLTTPSNNQIPIVDTSTAETNVMVADGTTVVIGGLRKDEKGYSNEQIPYLGHLPLIGPAFFKKTNRDNQLTELVVFITPHISQGDKMVTGDETPEFRDYREYAPVIKEPMAGARAR